MFPWIGAAGTALSLLNNVLQSSTASSTAKTGNNLFSSLGQTLTGNNGGQSNAVAGSGQGAPTLSSGTLATLIAMQGQDGANGRSVFARLDANGNGSISQSEFETAAKKAGLDTSSADALFGKLDTNSDGKISPTELANARGAYHHHHAGAKGRPSQLLNSTDAAGATTKTTTNADGSSTTTITYQDGSTVTMTTPASGSSGGTNQANLLEKLIQQQAQAAAQSGAAVSTTA